MGTTTRTGNVGLVQSLGADEVIDYKQREFSFDQANEALTYLEKGRAKGKVVVQMK